MHFGAADDVVLGQTASRITDPADVRGEAGWVVERSMCEHRDQNPQPTISDASQGAGMRVAAAAKRRVVPACRRIELGARTSLLGDPDPVLPKVKAFQKAGAEHVCAYFGSTVEEFVPGMRSFAREVMPAL